MLRFNNNNPQAITFTDEPGNTYTQAATCTDNSGSGGTGVVTRIYYVENTKAGARVITVHFSAFTGTVSMGEYEFYNVAQSSALDQAACNVGSGTTVTSGALSSLGTSGDLVFNSGVVDSNTMITGCTPSTQANITWTQRTTMILDNQPQCAQYGIYNATASFSPSFTVNANVNYVSASAAFKAASAGTPPAPGIRVNYIQHDDSIVQNLTTALTQMPISGNLAVIMYTGSGDYITGVSDGMNNWASVGPTHTCNPVANGDCSSIWYAAGVLPGVYKLNFTRFLPSGQQAAFGDSAQTG